MQKFLRGCPLTTHKIHILIHFDPQKDLKFRLFSSLIIEFSYANNPQNEYTRTNLNYLRAWDYAFYLTKNKFSYTRGRCLGPLSRVFPQDPIRDPIGGPGPYSWVLALRTWCFSLQAIPKSWKPWIIPPVKITHSAWFSNFSCLHTASDL